MKTRILSSVVLALGLAVAGCAQPTTPEVPTSVVAPGEGTVTATMQLSVQDASGRHLLALAGVEPWKKADIDHVTLSLYKAGTLVTTTTVAQASLSGTVTFANLHMNADYKVVAQAWSSANERIDAGETDPASCTTSFSTTNAEQVYVGAIALKLKTKVFSGTTSGSTIQVTDGAVESTHATETVTVEAPAPTLTSVSPHYVMDGQPLTLTGTNLADATSVTIGGMSVTIGSKSATSIVVTVPYMPVYGTVSVVVTTPTGTATTSVYYEQF